VSSVPVRPADLMRVVSGRHWVCSVAVVCRADVLLAQPGKPSNTSAIKRAHGAANRLGNASKKM